MGLHRMRNRNVFRTDGEGNIGAGKGRPTDGHRLRNGNVFRTAPVAEAAPAPATPPLQPTEAELREMTERLKGKPAESAAANAANGQAEPPVWENAVSPEAYLKQFGFEAANSELALAVLGVTREEAEILLAGDQG